MNKRLLKEICALTAAASLLAPSVPVLADAGTVEEKQIIFTEDFGSAASINDLSPKWFTGGDCSGCGIETVSGNKCMYVASAGPDSPVIAMAKNTVSADIADGTVRVSFDVYLENTSSEIKSFADYIGTSSQSDYGANQLISIHKPENGSAYIEGVEVETAKWYSVVTDFNLGAANKWSYGIAVYDTQGSLVGSTGQSGSALMGTFNNINFTSWSTAKTYIDNVSVKKIKRRLPFFDDMNSYKEGSSKTSLPNWTPEGYESETTGFETIDTAHGLTAYVTSDGAPRFAPYRITEPLTTGSVMLSFDTYITNTEKLWNRVTLVPSSTDDFGAYGVLNIDCGAGGTANVTTSSITPLANNIPVDAWYNVQLIFDLDAKTYTASLYDANGVQVGQTVTEAGSPEALSDFSTVSFTSWGGKFYFDNVKIEDFMSINVKHNGEENTSKILFDRNGFRFEASVHGGGQAHNDLTIEYTITDAAGSLVSYNSRVHPVKANETAVERFNVGELSPGSYTLGIRAAADGSDKAYYTKGITVADITAAQEPKNSRIGINSHVQYWGEEVTMDHAGSAGFGWVRDYLSWERCETEKGVYTFPAEYEEYVDRANNEGMKVLEQIVYGNRLYSANETDMPVSGEYKEAYLNYVRALATHFKGRIKAYEIWNEPNESKFNVSGASAADYASLLKDVYTTIKSIDPEALVLGMAYSGAAMTYADEVLSAGGGAYMDAFSIHPYNKMYLPEDRLRYDVAKAREKLNSYGYGSKPIWITEHGYYSECGVEYAVTEETQAAYLIRSSVLYDSYCKNTSTAGAYMWYDLRNDAKSAEDCPPGDETYTFGLLDYYYTPKKAYYAAAAFNKLTAGMELSSSDFNETVEANSIVKSGQYNAKYTNSSGSAVNVLWNAYGTNTVSLTVSGIKAVVYDMYGNVMTEHQLGGGTSTISVDTSTEPVYVLSVSAADSAVSERGETATTIFSDDFGYSGTDAMKNGGKWDVSDEAGTIAVENGAFAIKASSDTSKASPSITSKLTENIEKGNVRISFDMNIPSGDSGYKTLFALYDQNDIQQNVFVAEPGGDGNPVINMNGISEPSTWAGLKYDTNYRFVIDLNVGESEQNFYMTVYNKSDNSIAARFYKKGYANAWIFKNIRFMSWGTGKVLIDNVTIETISPKLAISDNFNGYNSSYSASAAKLWNVSASGAGFEQIDSAHGLTAYSSGYSTFAPHRLDRERTSGTLSIEFDTYLKAAPSWMTVAMGSYTNNDFGANQILYIQKDTNGSDILLYAAGSSGQFITLSLGKWYTVKMTVDLDNDTVTASVYDGGVLIGTSEGTSSGNYLALNFMADNSSTFYFDNVKVSDGSDIRVESTTVTVKKNSDTDKATGFLTRIINAGTSNGAFGSIRYNITSGGVTKSFTGTGYTTVTLEPNGYVSVALVVDGLYDKNADADVEIN